MFNVGGGELLVILLLGLLVLGPERLPKAMGEVGKWVAQLRRLSSGFQDEIRRAMDPDDAPFRPGEERIGVPAVDDEVRVVGADPADDGVIDTSAEEHDPSHLSAEDRSEPPADPSDRPTAAPHRPAAPAGEAPAEARAHADEHGEAGPAGPDNVTPLHGRDDGDARAAG